MLDFICGGFTELWGMGNKQKFLPKSIWYMHCHTFILLICHDRVRLLSTTHHLYNNVYNIKATHRPFNGVVSINVLHCLIQTFSIVKYLGQFHRKSFRTAVHWGWNSLNICSASIATSLWRQCESKLSDLQIEKKLWQTKNSPVKKPLRTYGAYNGIVCQTQRIISVYSALFLVFS